MNLSDKHCIACKGGSPLLKGGDLASFYRQLESGWQLIDEKRLEKEYSFKNFKEALYFTNQIGELAEAEKHHPDLYLAWGKVKVILWTHKIDGLTENDFIIAAKCDRIASMKRPRACQD